MMFLIVPAMPPADVRCAALSSQSLQISWQPPPTDYCNGVLQGYKLTYEPVLDDNWKGIYRFQYISVLFYSSFFKEMMNWKLEKLQH